MIQKILLVEDEIMLAQIIKDSLESRHFDVTHAKDGVEGFAIFEQNHFDCIVLDVMMPNMDGFTLIQKIRQRDTQTPVIFLTARTQTQDVVKGFELGGNDYLRKPFSIDELIVRIGALINRQISQVSDNQLFKIGKYLFHYTKQTLTQEETTQILSHREAEILYRLFQSKNQVLERKQVLLDLWGDDTFFNARSMDVFISKLRKYLSQDTDVQIVNIRGVGYKLILL
jgi:two-component system, OmpR family, response regulator VicR